MDNGNMNNTDMSNGNMNSTDMNNPNMNSANPYGGYGPNNAGNGAGPGYPPPYVDNAGRQEPVSVGEWLLALLIMCIPCANIIMMFIWAFSKNEKPSKSNYFKACLIWSAIVIGLVLLLYIILIVSVVGSSFGSYRGF